MISVLSLAFSSSSLVALPWHMQAGAVLPLVASVVCSAAAAFSQTGCLFLPDLTRELLFLRLHLP